MADASTEQELVPPADQSAVAEAAGAEEAATEEEAPKSKIIEVPISEVAMISCQADLDEVLTKHRAWMEQVLNPRVIVAAGRANLKGADLRPYDLTGINLSGANLSEANLQGVELSGANLTATNLRGATLQAANLKGARLVKTKLEDADMRHADLTDAVLRDTDLEVAILSDDDKRLKNRQENTLVLAPCSAAEMQSFATFDEGDAETLQLLRAEDNSSPV